MNRKIHDIYDVILKIIAITYQEIFLRYMGIEEDIEKIMNIEITTITGKKFYLDFLCLLKDGRLCHIEFQFPNAKSEDLDRFFNYNITAQARHQKITDTYIFNFNQKIQDEQYHKIGKTKSYHPKYFYLGNIDFKKYIESINKKEQTNKQLTSFEEITLMLICLNPKCENKAQIFKKICLLLKKEKLFDESKIEFIKAIIRLEIENLLTKEELTKFQEEIEMTPQVEEIITQAIKEVNMKVLSETREEALNEGLSLGKKEGKKEAMREIAKNLKDKLTIEEISKLTGFSPSEIEKL